MTDILMPALSPTMEEGTLAKWRVKPGDTVNARCLDEAEGLDIRIEPFDGKNWEAHGASLAHLSRDEAH